MSAADRSGIPPHDSAEAGFGRLARGFLIARVVLAGALLLVQVGLGLMGQAAEGLGQGVLTVAYGAMALGLTGVRWAPWWVGAATDLLVFSVLLALGGSLASPVPALLVLPVLVGSVLGSRRGALTSAALATLGLLAASLWVSLVNADWTPSFTQAGLAGVGYFAIALLSSELTARLKSEEVAAQGSLAMARQQEALNQLVISEMQEGVLVLDRTLRVRAANPAALVLLGERHPLAESPRSLHDDRAWRALADAVREAWDANLVDGWRDVTLGFLHAPVRALHVRPRWMNAPGEAEPLLVLLMEDRAKLQARARQEKLAAMGRMSAGIAHEIRNPLAAISQANALLAEDLPSPSSGQRLTALVASNVQRLQRIVDEVMLLAAPAEPAPTPMDATAGIGEALNDWWRTQPQAEVQLDLPTAALSVNFEPDHLRRVLVNLLDNAWRHAQAQPKPWVRVSLRELDRERAELRVVNPSPPLPPHIEQHLFEPFHSTRSRSSGLGLYICRELCERYGARIEYQALELDARAAVCFAVTLRRTP